MTEPTTELVQWADRAQYVSAPAESNAPRVTLVNATRDPLGTIASLTAMYSGRVVRSLREVSDEDRRTALDDMLKTSLDGALEAVSFTFLVENVSRAFTHQMVRTRAAFFAQESLRFAVVDDWANRISEPPGFDAWTEGQQDSWNAAIWEVSNAYQSLVNSGVPAEDARGLMPHALTTRIMVQMNLRTLIHQAGLRLCTQAQFEWRQVYAQIVKSLRPPVWEDEERPQPGDQHWFLWGVAGSGDNWQFAEIAKLLRPVCYQQGKCGFMASMDRGCKIRDRVNANEKLGRPSSEWETGSHKAANGLLTVQPISPAEWALDPGAARLTP